MWLCFVFFFVFMIVVPPGILWTAWKEGKERDAALLAAKQKEETENRQ